MWQAWQTGTLKVKGYSWRSLDMTWRTNLEIEVENLGEQQEIFTG
jgi:hypothetical protein